LWIVTKLIHFGLRDQILTKVVSLDHKDVEFGKTSCCIFSLPMRETSTKLFCSCPNIQLTKKLSFRRFLHNLPRFLIRQAGPTSQEAKPRVYPGVQHPHLLYKMGLNPGLNQGWGVLRFGLYKCNTMFSQTRHLVF
jgi:hypothetical protein